MSNTTDIKDSSNNAESDDKDASSYNLALSCLYNHITQYNLAYLYFKSDEKIEKAFYWFQKAAENGYKVAQHNLALYYNGEGTEKNLEKALYWSQKVLENGAMNNLNICSVNDEENEDESTMNNLNICSVNDE